MNDAFTHLSLFTGIGGLDLAAEWAGFRTTGQCEWADYPTKVLEKHWPNVARWRDIRTLTQESFYEHTGLRTVDVISGGFPCQPFSNAGKRRGAADDRYLWPEMLRVIQELRPTWVVGENVAGIVSLALDTVLSDLEIQGYQARAFIIPACGVDAPHRRDRVAIVAYTQCSERRKSKPARYEPDKKRQVGLEHQVRMVERGLWPTPTANDAKNSSLPPSQIKRKQLVGSIMKELAPQAKDSCGQLNPTWVEWLMGFPAGWTDLNASEMQ